MVTFDPKEMHGIVDLRSLGYYKIKQGVLQQNLSCMYHSESANKACDQFNKYLEKGRGRNLQYRQVSMVGG